MWWQRAVSIFFLVVIITGGVQASPRSRPLLEDRDIGNILSPLEGHSSLQKNYFNSTPGVLRDAKVVRHDSKDPSCNLNIKLKWNTDVGSSVFATPIIYPNTAGSEHKKQIFLSTYYQYVEMLDHDGSKPWGWPLSFEDASFASSPILYDIDGDGTMDIGVIDKDANMYWIQVGEYGRYNENYHIQVPKLKIKRDWHKGLDMNFMDEQIRLSMFDRQWEKLSEDGSIKINKTPFIKPDGLINIDQVTYPELNTKTSKRRLEGEAEKEEASRDADAEVLVRVNKDNSSEEQGTSSHPSGDDFVGGEYGYGDPRERMRRKGKFGDDDYIPYNHDIEMNDENFIFVDPHVLGSPAIADVNGDGRVDVIMAVSYYFDKNKFPSNFTDFEPDMYVAGGLVCWDIEGQDWAWMVHLDLTTDRSRFKALIYGSPTVVDLDGDGNAEVIIGTSLGLLYVLDGDTGLTKRFFPMQFHEIQAQIAVADIMGGNDLEIIVADMGGNVVVVDILGEILWDTKLSGELPHTPTIGDVDGDGKLDVVVVAVASDGSSHLWVLEGDTGLPLEGYPISLPKGAAISSPVILVDFHDYSKRAMDTSPVLLLSALAYEDPALPPWARHTRSGQGLAASPSGKQKGAKVQPEASLKEKLRGDGLHLLVPSFDGHLYIIDGVKGCAERVDVGEHIVSIPLVDDVSNDGFLDIVLGTMNGEVMLLETKIPYHPLNAWSSFPKNRMNGFTHGQQGISIPEVQKRLLKFAENKAGTVLPVTFDIWDSRRLMSDSLPARSYTVTVSKGLNKLAPLVSKTYDSAGRYTILVPVFPPESMVLILGMTNEYGQYFEDVAPVSIGTHFYVWIKYLVVAPVILVAVPLLLTTGKSSKLL